MRALDFIFGNSDRSRYADTMPAGSNDGMVGLPGLGEVDGRLYGQMLPRGVPLARARHDFEPVNRWARPDEALAALHCTDGGIILGKLAGMPLGFDDDRPAVTIAMARAGKTSTALKPNLYLYPGSMVVLDPKGELARETARVRRACGHRVYVLDHFSQSGLESAHFNLLDELDPEAWTIIDDVSSIAQAIIVDEGDIKNKHWSDSARTLLRGIILFALTRPKGERNLVTVRQLLTLTHPALVSAVRAAGTPGEPNGAYDEAYFAENKNAVETLLATMASMTNVFDGVLAATGRRFFNTPPNERGSIFSTASANTDFLDSGPLRAISRRSDFSLDMLRGDQPVTLYLCLPVGRMETHYRWLRMIIQQACITLERYGTYPRGRTPILFMMEEFATLGHMDLMERAAAYFPGFGVKLWAIIQDITQLQRNYPQTWESFLGNSGMVQCFANSDGPTLNYITERTAELIHPFELRTAFSRAGHGQILMIDGMPPVAAARLEHVDVEAIRDAVLAGASQRIAGYLAAG